MNFLNSRLPCVRLALALALLLLGGVGSAQAQWGGPPVNFNYNIGDYVDLTIPTFETTAREVRYTSNVSTSLLSSNLVFGISPGVAGVLHGYVASADNGQPHSVTFQAFAGLFSSTVLGTLVYNINVTGLSLFKRAGPPYVDANPVTYQVGVLKAQDTGILPAFASAAGINPSTTAKLEASARRRAILVTYSVSSGGETRILPHKGAASKYEIDVQHSSNSNSQVSSSVFPFVLSAAGSNDDVYYSWSRQGFRALAPTVMTYNINVDYYTIYRFGNPSQVKVASESVSQVFTLTINGPQLPAADDAANRGQGTIDMGDPENPQFKYPLPQWNQGEALRNTVINGQNVWQMPRIAHPYFNTPGANPDYVPRITYGLLKFNSDGTSTQIGLNSEMIPGVTVGGGGSRTGAPLLLTGIPTTPAPTTTFAYTATDVYGNSTAATFTIRVAGNLPNYFPMPNVTFYANQTVNYTLPVPHAYFNPTFTLFVDGDVPAGINAYWNLNSATASPTHFPGLTFDVYEGVLSGKVLESTVPQAETLGDKTLRLNLQASSFGIPGESGTIRRHTTFGITVFPELAFEKSPPNPLMLTETQVLDMTLPAAIGGFGALTYTLTDFPDPSGASTIGALAFDAQSRRITGTVALHQQSAGYDSVNTEVSNMVYTVTDSLGKQTIHNFAIQVKPRTSLYYTPPDGSLDATGPDQFPIEVYGNTVPGYGSPVDTPPFHDQLPHVFGDSPSGSSATRSGWGPYTYTLYSDNVFEFEQTGRKPYRTTQNYQLNNPCNPTCPLPVLPYPAGFDVPSYWVDEPGYIGLTHNSTGDSFGVGYYNEPYGKQPQMLALQYYTFSLTATDSNGVESVPLPIVLEIWPRLSFPSETAVTLTLPWASEFPNHLFFPSDVAHTYELPASVGGLHYYAAGGDASITRFTERYYGMLDIAGAQSFPGGFVYGGGTRLTHNPAGTTGQIYTFVIRGNDRINQVAFHTFTASANGDPVLHSIGDLTYTVGAPVSTLLSIQPGTGTPSFTAETIPNVVGPVPLPSGLSFDVSEYGKVRIVGVPADDSVGAYPTIIKVSDYFGNSGTIAQNITVLPAPSFAPQANLSYTAGHSVTPITFSAVDGALPLTYSFDPGNGLADGLTFSLIEPLMLSGAPTIETAETTYSVTATDVNGAEGAVSFTLQVFPDLTFPDDKLTVYTFGLDTEITITLTEADGGRPPVSYALTDNSGGLPAWLSFDSDARAFTASFSTLGDIALTYTAIDANDVREWFIFTATAIEPLSFRPPSINVTYSVGSPTYAIGGVAYTDDLTLPQANSGDGAITYGLEDNLPSGITATADGDELHISGTPSGIGDFTLQRFAEDSDEQATFTLTVHVASAPRFTASVAAQTYARNFSIAELSLPTVTYGAAPIVYALQDAGGIDFANGAVIAGLNFDAANRIVRGTPTAAVGDYPLTLQGIDVTTASDSLAFTITIVDALTFSLAQNDLTFTVGQAINNIELTAATGGVGSLTYGIALQNAADSALDGVTVTTADDTPTLSATTPTAVYATTPYVLTAHDISDNITAATFMITVVDAPVFTDVQDELTFTVSGDIGEITLPSASGGAMPLAYTFDNTIPSGLLFDADALLLTGTPLVEQATLNYQLTATDNNGITGDLPAFGIRIYPAPSFAANGFGPFTFTANAPQKSFALPQVVDGTGAPIVVYNFGALDLFNNGGDSGVNINDLVTLDATTRAVAGSFAATLQFRVQLTATDDNNVSDTSPYATFVVVDAVTFAQADLDNIADQTYRVGATINRILPQVTGGIAPIVYSLSDTSGNAYNNNIAGVAFTANTRAFAGTVASSATGDYTFTYAGKDDNDGEATAPMRINIVDALALPQPNDVIYYASMSGIDTALPQATNTIGVITYELQNLSDNGLTLPNGIIFNANANPPSLTGATDGNTVPATKYRYTATDSFDGASVTVTFNITVIDSPVLAAQDDVTFTVGTAKAVTLPSVVGGVAPHTYRLTTGAVGGLPDWLTYSGTSGENTVPLTFGSTTGSPSTAQNAVPLTYTVSDNKGIESSVTFNVVAVAAPSFSGTQDKLHATIGAAIADTQLPRASGGASPLSYSLAPNLPNGLTISENLLISGAPASDAIVGEADYTLTATDANGATAQLVFALEVYPPLAFTQPNPDAAQTFTVGIAKPLTFSPVSGGRTPLILALDLTGNNALSGLQFDATTRALTGTFAADTSAINLTYQATDQNGATIQYTFTLTAVPAPTFAGAQDDLTFTVSGDIGEITLPSASGGAVPLAYTFDNTMPSGILFDADELLLTGTPLVEQATVNYVLTATDVNGASGSLPAFGIRIYPAPSFAASGFGPFTFTANAPQKSFTLPQVVDGTGAPVVAYNFGELDLFNNGGDAGVNINDFVTLGANTRTVAGSFAAQLQFRVQLTATDSNNVSDTSPYATFVVVNEVTFSQADLDGIADQTYRVGANVNRILPQVTGGIAPIVYTLSGADGNAYGNNNNNNIAGVTFTASNRAFAGTVASTATGDYTLTYAGVDANGGKATTPMRVNIVAPLALPQQTDVIYYASMSGIDTALPQATNTIGVITYELQNLSDNGLTLPSGIVFNANANPPSLTGATDGNTFPTTKYRYTATDSFDGASVTVTFNITVIDSPVLAAQDDVTFTVGTAKAVTLPSVVGGVAPYTYRLTTGAVGGLPDWLTYSRMSGEDTAPLTFSNTTGSPLTAQDAVPLTYSVHDSEGTKVSVAFNVLAVAAPSFSGTQDELTFTVSGDIGEITLPSASGGAVPLAYTFDNTMPSGILFDADELLLTGTPLVEQATVNYVLTATDVNGASGSLPAFGIRIYPAPSFAASGFGPFTFTANAPQKSFTLPQVVDGTGAPVVAYNFGALNLFNNGGDSGVNIDDLVTLDATTRAVAGTFAAQLQFRVQLTATDSNNVSDTSPYATFVVVDAVTFSQSDLDNIADQTYRVGANVNRILPQVTGGIAPIVYTLSGADGNAYGNNNNNIAGVTFTASNRAFAGTVASTATGDYTLTYAGVDANGGKATTPMRVNIVAPLALPQQTDVIYYASMSGIDTALPQATNTIGVITYELQNLSDNGLTLPSGIVFNANANPPSLTGATDGNTFPTTKYRYTATDSFDGASVTVTFNITVIDSPVLAAQDDVTFTVGTAKAVTLPSVIGGVAPHTYLLTTNGNLPGWLTYSTSGEDTAPLTFGSTTSTTFSASAAVPLTYSVRDSEGTEASVAFNVVAVDAPRFTDTQDKLHATIGAAIADTQLPRASGGASPLSYSLAPNLPNGLTISENLLISGAPASNATVGEANYTLTATDANGATAQLVFALEVYPPLAFVQANPSVAQTYTVGVSKTLQFSQVEGGRAPLVFALELTGNTALSGMQFDESTRALTGTFATTTSAINLTYQATDQNGATIHYAFNITAVPAPHFIDTVGAQTYLRNRAITPLQLPSAADGATPLSYALTDSSANDFGNGAVIGGLAYANRRISGAPTAASGDYELRYRATDNNGAHAELTFVITIVDDLAFAQQNDLVFVINQPIVSELMQASGGIGALTYDIRAQRGAALSGIAVELRDGTLTLLADTRATEYAATPYILSVRDLVGNTAATTFTIRVVDGVAFLQQPSDVTFTVGIAKSVTLPPAHGFGTITYALSGAPSWLNLAPSSASTTDAFIISATPITMQSASVLTYGATDANAQSVSVTFAVLAVGPPRFTDTVADLTFTAGQTVEAITLPQAEDGALPLAYSLEPTLPSGMVWNRDSLELSGTPRTAQSNTSYSYTARDTNGATASLTFAIKIYPAANVTVSGYTFTVNWLGTHTLPESEIGAEPFNYLVLDEIGAAISTNGIPLAPTEPAQPSTNPALTFDPQSRELLGSYALSLEKVTSENLSYRVTDANGYVVYEPFAAVIFPTPTFIADGNITFAVSTFDLDNPFAHHLPKVKAGTGAPTITYQLGADVALPSWLSANLWMADGAQLTFAIAADPVVTVTIDRSTLDAVEAAFAQSQPLPTVTYQHMAIDANGANTTLPLRITLMPGVRAEFINDGVSRDFVDVSKVILSEAAGTLASNAIGAIANRIANARAGGFAVNGIGGQSPIFYLGGQHSLEGIIAANSKALADDTFDEKNLLSGTKFSLPFNAQGAPGDIGNGMAIWGAGEYKEMNGATGEVDWDGELRSLYFGIDGLMFANSDTLGGVAIAFSKLTADYADIGADTRAGSGDYEMRLTTLYPYYSWRNDNIDWWAGAGYGEGDLKITRNADRDYSTDVFMRTMAAGANILAGIFDRTRLHIKAETIVSRLKLSQSADLAQQKIDTGLARITAEVTAAKRLPGGGRYEPSYSFGWRYDFGDSDLDASLEKTFGWRFVNAAGRLSGELRLQGAYDGHTYREWGAYALIRSEAGADGQGVSLQLRPSYGATGLDVNRLWQGGGLQTFSDAVAPDEYAMQVDARVGFGVTGVWNGLLTPFAEWSYSAAGDVYRLGLDWAASEWLELRLIGEHQELEGGDIRRSVWVRGNAKF